MCYKVLPKKSLGKSRGGEGIGVQCTGSCLQKTVRTSLRGFEAIWLHVAKVMHSKQLLVIFACRQLFSFLFLRVIIFGASAFQTIACW